MEGRGFVEAVERKIGKHPIRTARTPGHFIGDR
jgi:hypothetical protein